MENDEGEGHALFGYASEQGIVFVLAEVCDDGARRPMRFDSSQHEGEHFSEHLEELQLELRIGPGRFFLTSPCIKGEKDWSKEPMSEPEGGWAEAFRGPCGWSDTVILPVPLPEGSEELSAVRRVAGTGLAAGLGEEGGIPDLLLPPPGTAKGLPQMVMLGSRDTVVTADGGHPVTFRTAEDAREFHRRMPVGRLVRRHVMELGVKQAADFILPNLASVVASGKLGGHVLVAWYNGSLYFELLQLGDRIWADNFEAASGSTH